MAVIACVLALLVSVVSVYPDELDIISCPPCSYRARQLKRSEHPHQFHRGPFRDHALVNGRVYHTAFTYSHLRCSGICLQDEACKSFNFCQHDRRCELNSAVFAQNMSDLQVSSGCLYYDETAHGECSPVVNVGDYVYNFMFPPLNSSDTFTIDFAVKGKSSAFLSLSEQPNQDNYYEIVIAGKFRTNSLIRASALPGPPSVKLATSGLMDKDEYRRFWIDYDLGTIRVGRAGEINPFMQWHDAERRVQVKHIGIAAQDTSAVQWIFYSFCDDRVNT